jgi:integrase
MVVKCKNTRCTVRDDAEKVLADFLVQLRSNYHLDEINQVERRRAIVAEVKTAEVALAEKQEADRLAAEARDALKIEDAFEVYRKRLTEVHKRKRKVVDEKTLDRYAAQFSSFVKWMADNHSEIVAVRDVSPALAQEWLDALSSLSGNSLNKRIVLMRSVWNLLGTAAWHKPDNKGAPVNPWEGSKRGGVIDKAKSDTVSKEPFTDEEVSRLLDMSQGEVKTLAFLAAYTGARLGDCVHFRWNMVNFKKRVISFVPHKTLHSSGRKVVLPLFDELSNHLKALPGFMLGGERKRNRDGLLVFDERIVPTLCDEYDQDAPGFLHKRLDPLYAKANIETRTEGIDGKMHTVKAWHSWRHYFATRCLQAGVAPAEVQQMLGWSSEQMLKVYFNPETKRILERMDEMAGSPTKALPSPTKEVCIAMTTTSALDAFRNACEALCRVGASASVWRRAEAILNKARNRLS